MSKKMNAEPTNLLRAKVGKQNGVRSAARRLGRSGLPWLVPFLLLTPFQLGAKGCQVGLVGSDLLAEEGASCGGLTGVGCTEGLFCDYSKEALCGAADATGVCRVVPEACTLIYAPVCGCDDKTYGNACAASAAAVSVAREGECPGTGGGNGSGGDGNGNGGSGATCGGLAGLGCPGGQYCDYPKEALCGAADQTGTCKEKAQVCAEIYAPVCGCDDKTYGNACEASGAGVSVAREGECISDGTDPGGGGNSGIICGGLLGVGCGEGQYCAYPKEAQCGAADQAGVCTDKAEVCPAIYAPVCGCDDKTYGNSCEASGAGVSVAHEGECSSGGGERVCGGLAGASCVSGEFCDFPKEALCGAADQTGVCKVKPEACNLIYAPVCGCDDKTYGNECSAWAEGVAVAYEGECKASG